MSPLRIILTTIDERKSAKKLVESIIEQKLAVCALISEESSIYHWQGSITESQEFLIKFKTLDTLSEQLKIAIQAEHPYDTCLITEIKTEYCNQEYLDYASSYLKN